MLVSIIPSKDRACQLDLLLDSIVKNCYIFDKLYILYTYSSYNFCNAYEDLIKKTEDRDLDIEVKFYTETNLYADFVWLVSQCKDDDIITMITDDTVFYRKTEILSRDIYEIIDDKTLAFSFRLGLNTTVQDYRYGSKQPPLLNYTTHKDKIVKWNWTEYYPLHNYGYCSGQDAVGYVGKVLKQMVKNKFPSLRSLEGTYALDKRNQLYGRPFMTSPKESLAVNIPTNNVQPGLYSGEKYPCSIEQLNDEYLNGQRLSLESMDFSNVVGAHQEIELKWKQQ